LQTYILFYTQDQQRKLDFLKRKFTTDI